VASPDLSPVVELLERRRDDGWHLGAQAYVSLGGVPVLDVAIGASTPGRALQVDDVMLWYSAGKPWTVAAILQLWERGRLGLDDLVADYLPGWGNGKERCTLRHVLTHTGGFPMPSDPLFDSDLSFEEEVAATAATRASWEPGTSAGYHPASGWRVLGAVVQAVDGRRIDDYLAAELATPLGCTSTSLGIPLDRQAELGERIVPVRWTGWTMPLMVEGAVRMVPYRVERWHNEPWHIAKVSPGGGMRGPARELGRIYESFLGFGPAVLEPRTVEVMRAVHRHGMPDRTFEGKPLPWGLGVSVTFSGGTGRHVFGHGGMASSRAFADPECGLVFCVVTNGLASPDQHEQRFLELVDATYSALGDDVARLRAPVEAASEAMGLRT
jgi:CubicO group peptidase (beta-lactamase class C family)